MAAFPLTLLCGRFTDIFHDHTDGSDVMRRLFVFLFSLLLAGQAIAQDVPAEGSVIKNQLIIGRSTFALPPGDWTVVTTNTSEVKVNGIGRGSGAASVYLAQRDAEGTYIASLSYRVPLASTAVASWTDTLCNRKDTLYRDAFSGRFDFPECLLINHVVPFWVNVPTNSADRKIWDWYKENKVKLPIAVLLGSYRKYFAGDYVQVDIAVNPEYFGEEKSLKSIWAESEWHPLVIKNDPKRLAFVENFKRWLYVMAGDASFTLKERKPKLATLPAFDEFSGVSIKEPSDLPKNSTRRSAEQRLLELKGLLDKGLITKEQFEEKQAAIIKML
jgi:hypothetical protein